MEKLVAFIEQDFLRWKDFDKSARLAAHSDIGVIELMPVADAQQYSFKYVNGHPANTEKGMLTVMAFGVLADVDTGYPVLLSELTLTTALRTAATSVMVAKKTGQKKLPYHGPDWQWLSKRVSGSGLPQAARDQ
ncbi:hypothetical protein [Vibrio natriegens]|uniref:hypothetical protein n=1 Tax=Vibrio natriegens TaxID=691 RepID=UPI0022B26743|nr:hypothetical protein [Vibrio natriegens]